MTISARSRAVLRSVNWFWPAYMRRGYVMDIITKLEAEPIGPQRIAAFEKHLAATYTAGHLAVMFLERYSQIPMVSPFKRHIGEAIEAAYLGIYHAAVALLITTIEGIVREHASEAQRDLRNAGIKQLTDEIRAMIEFEREKYPDCNASGERISMIDMFGEFLTESLYMHTLKFTGHRELNRHGAVHGIYRDYGNHTNFCLLISVIDLLAFMFTYRTSGISMFAPETTAESERLAHYYLDLRVIGRTAANAAGARPQASDLNQA